MLPRVGRIGRCSPRLALSVVGTKEGAHSWSPRLHTSQAYHATLKGCSLREEASRARRGGPSSAVASQDLGIRNEPVRLQGLYPCGVGAQKHGRRQRKPRLHFGFLQESTWDDTAPVEAVGQSRPNE